MGNIACITKLIWQIAQKKDNLWIKWIHARYLKSQNWRTYTPPSECSWYWRKILWVRDSVSYRLWMAPTFSVTACYLHLLGTMATTPWASIAWSQVASPRHSFIAWVGFHGKLPVMDRLVKFLNQPLPTDCSLCSSAVETHDHLFLHCRRSRQLWHHIHTWWPSKVKLASFQEFVASLKQVRQGPVRKQITFALHVAGLYYIWTARNCSRFEGQTIQPYTIFKQIKDHITQRVLHLAYSSPRYKRVVDRILM